MGRRAVILLLAVQAILLSLHPRSAAADWLGPVASPFFKGLCESVECGKGRCRTDSSRMLGYVCECDAGWTKLDDRFQQLPCVIPNCTLNYECSNRTAAAPAPSLPPLPPPSDHPLWDRNSSCPRILILN
ncbi:hypothetical protein Taro_036981 [Colocasia esculenta]|uniref:Uncharacterized protein n=1 Tax=Colocasia esculenta TaxID=4460 RepID=A0A843W4J1_COLES|nr:hypothetical protein [Colocasia esculenta]